MVDLRLFFCVVAFVGICRLLELCLAKRNAVYIRSIGGYEIAGEYYKWIVLVHVGFFAGLVAEAMAKAALLHAKLPFYLLPALLFFAVQWLRVWTLRTLGRFWNTRIFVVPGAEAVRIGPYRYLRHPNYAVVAIELLTLPLVFGLWRTALLFSLLNILVLRRRIRAEEQALSQAGDYSSAMNATPRFFPSPSAVFQSFKRFNRN